MLGHRLPRGAKVFRAFIATFIVLFLAGCNASIDTENARLCRMLLPVLHPAETVIDVAATSEIAVADGGPGIRIDYLAKLPEQRYSAHYVRCYFDARSIVERHPVLRALVSDRGEANASQLVFIARWLDDPDAIGETPGPGTSELARLPNVPPLVGGFLQHVFALLPLTGVYALLAVSYALLYGLIGRINLAFGAFAALGGIGGALALVVTQSAFELGATTITLIIVAMVLAVMLAASWGEAKAVLVIAPLERREQARFFAGSRAAAAHTGQPILIATAGLLIALPELLAIAQPSRWLAPVLNTPEIVARSGKLFITVTPIALIVFAASFALALAVLALMRFSAFGRAWRACADDPLTASLFGVSQMRILGRTITLACGLAGFAGFVYCLHYGNMGYSDGRMLGLKALVAAIAGGIGSLPGAILGGLLLGVLEALWSANLPIESRDIAIFMALVALLVIRPGGIFGFGDLAPRRV